MGASKRSVDPSLLHSTVAKGRLFQVSVETWVVLVFILQLVETGLSDHVQSWFEFRLGRNHELGGVQDGEYVFG